MPVVQNIYLVIVLPGFAAFCGGVVIMTIKRFNKLRLLYNEVTTLDADINTELGHRRDLLLKARMFAKDYQDHELRMKALRPDANVVIASTATSNVPPILPLVSSSGVTKADESQSKLQADINQVEHDLRLQIKAQHQAVKAYRNYRDTFPNNLFARLVKADEVDYYRYREDDSLFKIDDVYAADRDIHRSILNAAISTNPGLLPHAAVRPEIVAPAART
jgi:hypothetical protein